MPCCTPNHVYTNPMRTGPSASKTVHTNIRCSHRDLTHTYVRTYLVPSPHHIHAPNAPTTAHNIPIILFRLLLPQTIPQHIRGRARAASSPTPRLLPRWAATNALKPPWARVSTLFAESIARMGDNRLPRVALLGGLEGGTRYSGGQEFGRLERLQEDLPAAGIQRRKGPRSEYHDSGGMVR